MRRVIRHYLPAILLLPLLIVATLAAPTDLDYSLSRIASLQVDSIGLSGQFEVNNDQFGYTIVVSLAVSTPSPIKLAFDPNPLPFTFVADLNFTTIDNLTLEYIEVDRKLVVQPPLFSDTSSFILAIPSGFHQIMDVRFIIYYADTPSPFPPIGSYTFTPNQPQIVPLGGLLFRSPAHLHLQSLYLEVNTFFEGISINHDPPYLIPSNTLQLPYAIAVFNLLLLTLVTYWRYRLPRNYITEEEDTLFPRL